MRWGWILGAVALAAFLLIRRHKLSRALLVGGWVAVAAAAAVGAGLVPLPNLEKLIEDLGQALGTWTYLLVGVLAFLETGAFVGLIAPGETTVIVGGVVAGQGQISLLVLIAITWTCAVAGDVTSYFLGRKLGRAWLVRNGARVKITEDRLHQVEEFFDRHGGATILVGRFIGFVRALAPFIAGASAMPLRRFLPYDVLGAGAWAATFCLLGYFFWQSFGTLTDYVSTGLLAFGSVVAVVVGIVLLVRLRRDAEQRARVRAWLDERSDGPLGPLVRAARPAWRFVGKPFAGVADLAARFGWARLTPGDLGLELTTLLALAAVGGFSFFFIGSLIDHPALPGIDRFAAGRALDLAAEPLLHVARVVTELGSSVVTGAAALATAVWAMTRRRPIDAVALIAGFIALVVAVHLAKAGYGRARPGDGFYQLDSDAYPSGHTAYAVTLVACATMLVRAGSGWAIRFAAVTVAIVIVAVVGVTRVYLRVHHFTDVLGGLALGVAIWSIVGALALVAGHVRHNGSGTDV